MSKNVALSGSFLGDDTGPFSIYHTSVSGPNFLMTASRSELLAGINVTGIPDAAVILYAVSNGVCTSVGSWIFPTPTSTPLSTPTNTPQNTPQNTPTRTATLSNTPTNTIPGAATPTVTNPATPTNTLTNTPANTPTNTLANTPTNTFANTPTNTGTLANTPTNTLTNTPTNTPTATCSPTLISPNLTYDGSSGPAACIAGDFTPYYGNDSALDLTTVLYSNSSCTPAAAGYYSDGTGYRYWSGTSFGAYTAC